MHIPQARGIDSDEDAMVCLDMCIFGESINIFLVAVFILTSNHINVKG